MSTLQNHIGTTPAKAAVPPPPSPVVPALPDGASATVKAVREKRLLDIFLEKIHTITMSILIVALLIYLLKTFSVMLQQLLVALFLAYLVLPLRNWLSRYRLSGLLTYSI